MTTCQQQPSCHPISEIHFSSDFKFFEKRDYWFYANKWHFWSTRLWLGDKVLWNKHGFLLHMLNKILWEAMSLDWVSSLGPMYHTNKQFNSGN
jgi:hypothetical protein